MKTRIIIHHTADDKPGPQLERVDEWHEKRGFPKSKRGYFVGYHYLIEADGSVVQTRGIEEEGAHTKGYNDEAVGIALAGNFDNVVPSGAQMNSLQNLLDAIQKETEGAVLDISFHREFAVTSCPGRNFTERFLIQYLAARASDYLTKLLLWIQLILKKI